MCDFQRKEVLKPCIEVLLQQVTIKLKQLKKLTDIHLKLMEVYLKSASVIGMIPYAGLSFYCFESLKYCCMKYIPLWTTQPCPNNSGKTQLSAVLNE